MTDGLKAQGVTALVALPVSMFVIHSVVGYPLTSLMLRQEGGRLVKEFKANGSKLDPEAAEFAAGQQPSVFKSQNVFNLKPEYETPAFILARVAMVALFSTWCAGLTQMLFV